MSVETEIAALSELARRLSAPWPAEEAAHLRYRPLQPGRARVYSVGDRYPHVRTRYDADPNWRDRVADEDRVARDRAARVLQGVRFTATLAGAIHREPRAGGNWGDSVLDRVRAAQAEGFLGGDMIAVEREVAALRELARRSSERWPAYVAAERRRGWDVTDDGVVTGYRLKSPPDSPELRARLAALARIPIGEFAARPPVVDHSPRWGEHIHGLSETDRITFNGVPFRISGTGTLPGGLRDDVDYQIAEPLEPRFHDPSRVRLTFGGREIEGFVEGGMIAVDAEGHQRAGIDPTTGRMPRGDADDERFFAQRVAEHQRAAGRLLGFGSGPGGAPSALPGTVRVSIADEAGEVIGFRDEPLPSGATARTARQMGRSEIRDRGFFAYHPWSWMPSIAGVGRIALRWGATDRSAPLHVPDCPRTNNPPTDPCVCEHWDLPRDTIEGGSGGEAMPARGRRLDRAALGELAARYAARRPDGSYNRHDARRWMRRFAVEAAVASDALEQGDRIAAIRGLIEMVGLDDAVRLTERPPAPRGFLNTFIADGSRVGLYVDDPDAALPSADREAARQWFQTQYMQRPHPVPTTSFSARVGPPRGLRAGWWIDPDVGAPWLDHGRDLETVAAELERRLRAEPGITSAHVTPGEGRTLRVSVTGDPATVRGGATTPGRADLVIAAGDPVPTTDADVSRRVRDLLAAMDPSAAAGADLDRLAELTGTEPRGPAGDGSPPDQT